MFHGLEIQNLEKLKPELRRSNRRDRRRECHLPSAARRTSMWRCEAVIFGHFSFFVTVFIYTSNSFVLKWNIVWLWTVESYYALRNLRNVYYKVQLTKVTFIYSISDVFVSRTDLNQTVAFNVEIPFKFNPIQIKRTHYWNATTFYNNPNSCIEGIFSRAKIIWRGASPSWFIFIIAYSASPSRVIVLLKTGSQNDSP